MTSMDDPEQRLAEALRARASQTGWPAGGVSAASPQQQAAGPWQPPPTAAPRTNPTGRTGPHPAPSRSLRNQVRWALFVALLAGAGLGCAIALLSVLVPGLLPPLG